MLQRARVPGQHAQRCRRELPAPGAAATRCCHGTFSRTVHRPAGRTGHERPLCLVHLGHIVAPEAALGLVHHERRQRKAQERLRAVQAGQAAQRRGAARLSRAAHGRRQCERRRQARQLHRQLQPEAHLRASRCSGAAVRRRVWTQSKTRTPWSGCTALAGRAQRSAWDAAQSGRRLFSAEYAVAWQLGVPA